MTNGVVIGRTGGDASGCLNFLMTTTTSDSNTKPPEADGSGATPADTREQMTKLAGRGYAQFRGVLVQLPDEDENGLRASTLSRMVSDRRHRELILYMWVLTNWTWLQDRDMPLEAGVWVRSLTAPGGLTWSQSTLSRSWKHLEELGLLEPRTREDRLVRITPRREDGHEAYTPPEGRTEWEHVYFTMPDSFWTDEWFAKLSLPALAVFLVMLKETNDSKRQEFRFTYKQLEPWYGLKPRTVQNGVDQLQELGLITSRDEVIKAPLSATGKTIRRHYALTGDFSQISRAKLRQVARRERASREKKQGAKQASPRDSDNAQGLT